MKTYLISVGVFIVVFAPSFSSVYVHPYCATRTTIWTQMIIPTRTIRPNDRCPVIIDVAMLIVVPWVIGLVIAGSWIFVGHNVADTWLYTLNYHCWIQIYGCNFEIHVSNLYSIRILGPKGVCENQIFLFSKMKLQMKFLIIWIILKYHLEKSKISKQL